MSARFIAPLVRLCKDQRGATAIEYGFIAVLISLAGFLAFQTLGSSISNMFIAIDSNIVGATPGRGGPSQPTG